MQIHGVFICIIGEHKFFSSVSYECIILFHTVTAQKSSGTGLILRHRIRARRLNEWVITTKKGGGYYEGRSLYAFHPSIHPFNSFLLGYMSH